MATMMSNLGYGDPNAQRERMIARRQARRDGAMRDLGQALDAMQQRRQRERELADLRDSFLNPDHAPKYAAGAKVKAERDAAQQKRADELAAAQQAQRYKIEQDRLAAAFKERELDELRAYHEGMLGARKREEEGRERRDRRGEWHGTLRRGISAVGDVLGNVLGRRGNPQDDEYKRMRNERMRRLLNEKPGDKLWERAVLEAERNNVWGDAEDTLRDAHRLYDRVKAGRDPVDDFDYRKEAEGMGWKGPK